MMLTAVVVFTAVTELPNDVVVALIEIMFEDTYKKIQSLYIPLIDLFDLLTLTDLTVNFTLYCTMSRQFRMTFRRLFFGRPYMAYSSSRRGVTTDDSQVNNTQSSMRRTQTSLRKTQTIAQTIVQTNPCSSGGLRSVIARGQSQDQNI